MIYSKIECFIVKQNNIYSTLAARQYGEAPNTQREIFLESC